MIDPQIIAAERQNSNATIDPKRNEERKTTRTRSLESESFVDELNNQTSMKNSNYDDSPIAPITENILVNYVRLSTFANDNGNLTVPSNYPSNDKLSSGGIFSMEVKERHFS